MIVVGYAALSLWRYRSRAAKGLVHKPLALVLLQIVVLAGIALGLTYLLSQNRAPNPNLFNISGIPWVAPVVVALLLFWTFMLTRTRFGRHLYAVGGNAEAARRAGINVTRIKVTAFMICSGMAAIAGILSASYSGKVSPGSGGGNELLYAVGAAVIGGTSLFGGRGRAIDARHRRPGDRDHPQRARAAQPGQLHQLPGDRRRAAAGGERRRHLPAAPFRSRRVARCPPQGAAPAPTRRPSGATTSGPCCGTCTAPVSSRAPS